jgi:hypothetical protein
MRTQKEIGLNDDVVLSDHSPRINVTMRLSIRGASLPTWGYFGDGPADTAFNILLAANLHPDTAADLHDQFVRDFLHGLPGEGGRIPAEAVNAWSERQQNCEHPAFEFRGLRRPAEDGSDARIAEALGDDYCVACGCGKRTLERRASGRFRRRTYPAW